MGALSGRETEIVVLAARGLPHARIAEELAISLNPSRSLIISQVVLSFGIPFALIPLLILCRNRNVMGTLVNHRLTTAIAMVVVSLNVDLLYQTFFA